jgi:hypothetical protein
LRRRVRHLWGGVLARFEVHVVIRWWELRDLFTGADEIGRADRPVRHPPPSLEQLELRWLMSNGVTEFAVPTGGCPPSRNSCHFSRLIL